jgi:hypothetical protein
MATGGVVELQNEQETKFGAEIVDTFVHIFNIVSRILWRKQTLSCLLNIL